MDLVSIQKFLRPGKPRAEDYVRFLQLLLHGISLHAVEANETDLTRFREEVAAISVKLTEQSTTQDIDSALDFVIRAVDGYNRIAARMNQAHLAELQAMLAMTTDTISFLGDSSQSGIEQLRVLEKNLQRASSIGDVRELRSRLDHCLTLVRSESNRLRDQSHARIAVLQKGLERTANHVRSLGVVVAEPPAVDFTEREGRDAAEHLIGANIAHGKPFAIAVFVIDGLAQIAGRYGEQTRAEVLQSVTEYLEERLAAAKIFEWSGPALAAILEITTSFQPIDRQMNEVAAMRLEKTMETDGRFTLLPITCSHIVQQVSDADSVEAVVANLDDFVAAHAGSRR